jgi:hypothetical protein
MSRRVLKQETEQDGIDFTQTIIGFVATAATEDLVRFSDFLKFAKGSCIKEGLLHTSAASALAPTNWGSLTFAKYSSIDLFG